MGTQLNVDDPTVKELFYRKLWEWAAANPDGKTRSRRHSNPSKLLCELGESFAVKLTRTSAQQLSRRLGEWVTIDWSVNPFTITCNIDPARLQESALKAQEVDGAAPVDRQQTPITAYRAYKTLYDRAESTGIGVEYWVKGDPLKILTGKHPGRDVAEPLREIVRLRWAEWRRVVLQGRPDPVDKLHLLVRPDDIRPKDEVDEAPPPPPKTVVEVPAVAKRRQLGVYLTAFEEKVLRRFFEDADERESAAPVLKITQLREVADGVNGDKLLEAIGRLCEEDLLLCIAPNTYRLNCHEADVVIKPTVRRIILAPKARMNDLKVAREIATALVRADGTIDSSEFSARVAAAWDTQRTVVMGVLADYDSEEVGAAGKSLRLIVRPSPNSFSLLLAPPSLSGCDFFESSDARRKRSAVIMHGQDLYMEFAAQLRRRYIEAAQFKGPAQAASAPRPITQPPPMPQPVAAPAAATAPEQSAPPPPIVEHEVPVASPPAPSDDLQARQLALTSLLETHEADEAQARARVAQLRAQVDEAEVRVRELAERSSATRAEIEAVKRAIAQARKAQLDAQLADIERQRQALEAAQEALRRERESLD